MKHRIYALFITLVLSAHAQAAEQCQDIENEVFANNSCTKIKTFKSQLVSQAPILLVALHGDAPRGKPSYQYKFAQTLAQKSDNTIAIGMLRPGYTDPEQRTSDGIRGKTVGDNYDEPRVKQIAQAIQKLKQQHKAQKVIVAGHSGGAAITANLIGMYPDLVDHALIVSCPCNINAWRKDMRALSDYKGFIGDIDNTSPVDLVSKVSDSTSITLFVGQEDKVTKPYLTRQYKTALQQANKQVQMQVIEGGHEIFLRPEVIASLQQQIASYNRQGL